MSNFAPIETHRGAVVAGGGVVSASQPLAVSAGLAVLARGGTFADAAIATSAVLCVVEPQSSHLGGDAFLIVYDAQIRQYDVEARPTVAFNGSGAAPHGATLDYYAGNIPLRGLRAATVPGLVSTWFALHERYGTLRMSELLQPAIDYAESGFFAGPRLARVCETYAPVLRDYPQMAHALNLRPGLHVGEKVVQPDLAWTLKQIATGGRDAFYKGAIVEKIADYARAHFDEHFTVDDFAAHETRVSPPITTRYRHLTVHGQPPPSQGLILLEELALANGYDLAQMDEATRTHVLVEMKKIAFADRNRYLGDLETAPVPVDALLSPTFLQSRRAEIDMERARPEYPGGDLTGMGTDTTYLLTRDSW